MRKISQMFKEFETLRKIDKAAGDTVCIDEWRRSLSEAEIDLLRSVLNDFMSGIEPVSNLLRNAKLSLEK